MVNDEYTLSLDKYLPMKSVSITKSITVNAPANCIWQVFTKPSVTKAMGGEYVSDWKEGSAIGWKGNDGNMYTSGRIIQLEEPRLIKHRLFHMDNQDVQLSLITYRFSEQDGLTVIEAKEELNYEINEDQLSEISKGWDYALQALKETAEKLSRKENI